MDFFANYHTILNHAMKEKVDAIVHGGDVFFRSKIPRPIIEKTYEPLLPVLESGIDILMVPGNHERSRLPVSPLFHHPRMHIFDRPRTFSINRGGLKVAFGGFPNIRNQSSENFQGAIADSHLLDTSADRKVLCIHQSIEDAVVGTQNYRFRRGPDVIGRHQFPSALDLVLCGHIHRQQVLTAVSGPPIIFPGSIERTSYAEREETKGYFMLELSREEMVWEFEPLPSRLMLEWELKPEIIDEATLVADLRSRMESLPADSILRIRCTSVKQLEFVKITSMRELFSETINVEILPPPGSSTYHRMKTKS